VNEETKNGNKHQRPLRDNSPARIFPGPWSPSSPERVFPGGKEFRTLLSSGTAATDEAITYGNTRMHPRGCPDVWYASFDPLPVTHVLTSTTLISRRKTDTIGTTRKMPHTHRQDHTLLATEAIPVITMPWSRDRIFSYSVIAKRRSRPTSSPGGEKLS
jgi:hypothetical protein